MSSAHLNRLAAISYYSHVSVLNDKHISTEKENYDIVWKQILGELCEADQIVQNIFKEKNSDQELKHELRHKYSLKL